MNAPLYFDYILISSFSVVIASQLLLVDEVLRAKQSKAPAGPDMDAMGGD